MASADVSDADMLLVRSITPVTKELLAGSQQDFPVLEDDQPVGILRRNDLVKALSEGRSETLISGAMCHDCETVDEAAPLRSTIEAMHTRQCATMPVVAGGRMIGLLTLENISEMMMVNAAIKKQGATHP